MALTKLSTTMIEDSAITAVKINADAITAAKIGDDVINSEHLVDGGVDDAHLATGITASKLTGNLPAINGASLTNLPSTALYTLIEMQTTAGTTREFDLATATYDMGFLIQFHNVYPSTAGGLYAYLSSDGGSSWHNSYSWGVNGGDHDGAHIATGGATVAMIKIIPNTQRTNAYSGASGWMYIPNTNEGANTHTTWHIAYMENTTADREVISGVHGNETSVINHNAIKFSYENGGNVNGRLALYGMKGS